MTRTLLTQPQLSRTYIDGENLVFGTSTGTMIGTSASQKMGFYGVTPVIKPANIPAAGATLGSVQTTINSALTLLQSLGLMT